ncbi:tannase/feruloyl esterase family alpha/beta hydrolase [Novosphingobium sp. 9]|uniref:tannase/feruloyl esterase family alpha/beta hydrolase n=1 Tax=Novosphingobium sp. 9 TaxID=2025349 RepID=UPI0021B50E05|nr:tannase/feruloyl esterase family alpha/beta hydrolase [Novosphingobium sp. 9]
MRFRITMWLATLIAAFALTSGAVQARNAPTGQSLAVVRPVVSCAALSATDLTAIGGAGSGVTSATLDKSDGIEVCDVKGTLTPKVNFEVLLPTKTWSQRYLQVGCGGLCGDITLRSGASSGCKVLNDGGFVMAATDMGHTGQSGEWGLDDQRRADFAYRAEHITGQAAKLLIRKFYGRAQKYAYFNGCSDGGREALMEAQRFPDDFDGVIAGAPAMLFQVQNTLYHGWMATVNRDAAGHNILLSAKLPALHAAVLAACDGNDGVTDGIVAVPAACRFDPAVLACKTGQSGNACLTAAEIDVVRKFYEGPRDPKTGSPLTAGQPLYGSELNWQGIYVPDSDGGMMMSTMIVPPVWKDIAFVPPRTTATMADWTFDTATLDALRARHTLFDATNANLDAFAARGGKLILWHGLGDPHISPANTVSYQQAIEKAMGRDRVNGFERLYLLPGVAHCGGGQGPSALDLLSAMMAWVEGGHAPDAILTSTTATESSFGQPTAGSKGGARQGPPPMAKLETAALPAMTRPVYPYPFVAKYKGTGDYTKAVNWEKGAATQVVALHPWPGSDLFAPFIFSDK